MKKIIALVLALLLLAAPLSLGVCAVSEESDTYVARMWICQKNKNYGSFGHMFLYFENLTDEPLVVGRYTVPAYDSVSVGTLGFSGPRGFGLYYNTETASSNKSGIMAKSTMLTKAQFDLISSKIKSYNYWDPLFNCTHFAITMWNKGPGKNISLCIFPSLGRKYIAKIGGTVDSVKLADKTSADIYKQTELKK